jgi:large conductance mechanosensitive channel
MAKEKGKGFFAEFKKFITRGNVLDMAVGVIVGGAFTAIVNALSNSILKPIINWVLALVFGKKGLTELLTFLPKGKVYKDILNDAGKVIGKSTEIDLAASFYIDWGAVITAVINFLLIAFVLFCIVRVMNKVAEAKTDAVNSAQLERNQKKEIKKIAKEEKVTRLVAESIYLQRLEEAKAAKAEEERIAAEKAAEEARLAEEKAMANTVLLTQIRDLLQNKQ